MSNSHVVAETHVKLARPIHNNSPSGETSSEPIATLPKFDFTMNILPAAVTTAQIIARVKSLQAARKVSAEGEIKDQQPSKGGYPGKRFDARIPLLAKMGAFEDSATREEDSATKEGVLNSLVTKVYAEFRKFVQSPDFVAKVLGENCDFNQLKPGELQARTLAAFAIEQNKIDQKHLIALRRFMPFAALEILSSMADSTFTGDPALSNQWSAAAAYIESCLKKANPDLATLNKIANFGLDRGRGWPRADMVRAMEIVLEQGQK